MLTHILLRILVSVLMPMMAFAGKADGDVSRFALDEPFEQEVIITAYYSPLPQQCCFVKGSYIDDKILNGQGTHGADGTPVYAGMAAAPSTYPFGTRIVLPGIGTVTVHDRGGAIVEKQEGHRLDLWVGSGEEGLARALAFGVKRVRATIYPPGAQQPAETFVLASLPSPHERLHPYRVAQTTLLDVSVTYGDRTASAEFLQEKLGGLGYFKGTPTGFFGPQTKDAFETFLADMRSTEPADRLTKESASLLEAAARREDAPAPIENVIGPGSSGPRVASAQRLLRFLGYYKGRTDGRYDDDVRGAVLSFQKEQGIIANEKTVGAGRIGPRTRHALNTLWRSRHAHQLADKLITEKEIEGVLATKGILLTQQLSKGQTGTQVKQLQRFLALRGYLEKDGQTGTFGDRTEKALIDFQMKLGIITDAKMRGAGVLGPATLSRVRQTQIRDALKIVREKGMEAL